MDTNDLRGLLHDQSVATNLTPEGMWRTAQRRKAARRRAGAITAVVAVTLAASASAIYLHGGSFNPNPPVLATPSSPASPTPSGSPSQEPTTPAATLTPVPASPTIGEPNPKPLDGCTRAFSESWTAALEAAPTLDALPGGTVLKSGARVAVHGTDADTLKWHGPGAGSQEQVIDDRASYQNGTYRSDGRYVVYLGADDRLKVWDDQTANDPAKVLDTGDIDFASADWQLSNGQLWIMHWIESDSARGGKLYHLDLAAGGAPKLVDEFANSILGRSFDGRAQVLSDRRAVFVSPDGAQEPAPESWGEKVALERSGEIYVLGVFGTEDPSTWLYHPGWKELYLIEGGASRDGNGVAGFSGLEGEWVALGDNGVLNLRQNFVMQADSAQPSTYLIEGFEGNRYLVREWDTSDGNRHRKAVKFSDLPPVGVEGCS